MSQIKNVKVPGSELVEVNRKAVGHRAIWMGLIYDELRKEGLDADGIIRRAIHRCGEIHGAGFIENMEDKTSCADFRVAFINDVGKESFQIDLLEVKDDSLRCEFHYCPLITAWQSLGFDDDTCDKLCDLAMEGDRAIAKTVGFDFNLEQTIAQGKPTCRLHFQSKAQV